jgi:hypothetical protein
MNRTWWRAKPDMYKFAAACACSLALAPLALAQGATGTELPEATPVWRYAVRPGDTLIAIGQRYLLDPSRWDAVQRLNHIADPRRMPPGTVVQIPANLLRSAPGQARLLAVHGQVRWREADAAWQDARPGQALAAGAELQTDGQANAVLELANGTRLALHPGSVLRLDTLSLYAGGLMADTRVRLQQGQAEITANPRQLPQQHLRVLTPSAQAVVRGTVFRVGVQPDSTREETVEGSVSVAAAGQSVQVGAAQGTLARAGEAPQPARALLRAPDVSAMPMRLEQLPLRFVSPAAPGRVAWWGQIAPDERFETLLAEKTSSTDALNFADLPNGRYVLRVRALDGLGLQGLEARHAFTVWARPFAPTLQAPGKAATVRNPRPALAWTAAVGAERYRLQLAQSMDFAQTLSDQTLEQAGWTPASDLPPGPWFWRVASVNGANEQGPWSAAADFRYKPGPGAPDLGRTAWRYEGDRLLLELPAPPPDQHYRVALSATAEMPADVLQQSSSDGHLSLPHPGAGSHFLGVRLIDNEDGTAGPAMLQQFTAPARHPYLWLLLLPLLLGL